MSSDFNQAFRDNFLKSDNNRGIDALINNAGVVMQERQVNEDGVEVCFATAMGGTLYCHHFV